jgi:hypothetical protein
MKTLNPNINCNDGIAIKTYNSGTGYNSGTFTDATGTPGGVFSYRACVTDSAGDFSAFSGATATAVISKSGSTSYHKVFVTSTAYDGNLGGAAGADAKCNARATAAGLPGTWTSILSSGSTAAQSRFNLSGPVYNMASKVVATGQGSLWSGGLYNYINYDEFGADVGGQLVWSASHSSGNVLGGTCSAWTNNTDPSGVYVWGTTNNRSAWWIHIEGYFAGYNTNCASFARLFCISSALP